MLILSQKHSKHLENDKLLLFAGSLPAFLFPPTPERHPHTSPGGVFLALFLLCSLISLFHLELVEDSQGPFLLRHSAPVCTKAKRTNHFTVSDLGYIYLNICTEDMNVTEVTLEVGVGSPVLISYNVSHPGQDSFIFKGFAEQQ